MATNKNQHFVPRVYLKPFTHNEEDRSICLYNIDRQRFIECAPVKNQCSGDYFYGQDDDLENAIRAIEGAYGRTLTRIRAPSYQLDLEDAQTLRYFWLFQHLRTEAASRRAMEMTDLSQDAIDISHEAFTIGIKQAVHASMRAFAESIHAIDDLNVCLIRNRTTYPFVTSDDPAILSNRWFIHSPLTRKSAFGVSSAGMLAILPLTADILFLAFDGDIYGVGDKNGWAAARNEVDIRAVNEHQYLNCWANIYVANTLHSKMVHEAFLAALPRRPVARHRINYAVRDNQKDGSVRYRVIPNPHAEPHTEALVHFEAIQPHPGSWPSFISKKPTAFAFTNDTGVGYVRRAYAHSHHRPFRKVRA